MILWIVNDVYPRSHIHPVAIFGLTADKITWLCRLSPCPLRSVSRKRAKIKHVHEHRSLRKTRLNSGWVVFPHKHPRFSVSLSPFFLPDGFSGGSAIGKKSLGPLPWLQPGNGVHPGSCRETLRLGVSDPIGLQAVRCSGGFCLLEWPTGAGASVGGENADMKTDINYTKQAGLSPDNDAGRKPGLGPYQP